MIPTNAIHVNCIKRTCKFLLSVELDLFSMFSHAIRRGRRQDFRNYGQLGWGGGFPQRGQLRGKLLI